MLAAFDFTSWYATLNYVVGGLLVLVAAAEKLVGWSGWLRKRRRPSERSVVVDEPDVVLGHPGGEQSMTPLHELTGDESRRLTRVAPRYLIENKDRVGIRDVTTGVRTRDGREHRFDEFFAGLVGAGETAEVAIAGWIPPELFEGVHESEAFTAFLYWARFRRGGVRWDCLRPADAQERLSRTPLGRTEARRTRTRDGSSKHVIDVSNPGDSPVQKIEIDFPAEAQNWHLLIEATATYPIRVLGPGDSQSISVVVTMGGPVAEDRSRRESVPSRSVTRTRRAR